METDTRPT